MSKAHRRRILRARGAGPEAGSPATMSGAAQCAGDKRPAAGHSRAGQKRRSVRGAARAAVATLAVAFDSEEDEESGDSEGGSAEDGTAARDANNGGALEGSKQGPQEYRVTQVRDQQGRSAASCGAAGTGLPCGGGGRVACGLWPRVRPALLFWRALP